MTPTRLVLALVATLAPMPAALGDDARQLRDDRAAVAACLEGAAKAKRGAESCIGAVQGPCFKAPDGDTTAGANDCTAREIAV